MRPHKLLNDCLLYAASQTHDPKQQIEILHSLCDRNVAALRKRGIMVCSDYANTEAFYQVCWARVCMATNTIQHNYNTYNDMINALNKEQQKYHWWQYNYCGLNEDGVLMLADELTTFDCFLYKGTSNQSTIYIIEHP